MDTPLKLTNLQIARLLSALNNLEGIRISPNEFRPFAFNPEHSWKIASNIAFLSPVVIAFERAKKHLFSQSKIEEGETVTPENASKAELLFSALEGLEDKVIEVADLEPLSKEKLNVGNDSKQKQNPIPPAVLAALSPILEP